MKVLGCRLGAIGALVACTGCLWQGESPAILGVDVRLTVLHTTDIHSRLFPFDLQPNATDRQLGFDLENAPFGGAARLAYLIKRERARADRVLYVDSGDCFQGAPVFNAHMGEAEIRFLTNVGLDAAVIGNHEFDEGVQVLANQLERWASFDVLAANYIMADFTDPNQNTLGIKAAPYAIYNIDGLRIAVIGMGNLGSLSSIGEGGNSLGLTPLEQNETAREYINLLHSSVDLTMVVSHLGLVEDEWLITGYEKTTWPDRVHPNWEVLRQLPDGRVDVWVPGVRNLDVIMGGHLHVVLNPPKVVRDVDGRNVVIAHSGAFSKFLGRLDLVLKDDTERGGKMVVSHKYQVFPVDNRLREWEDPQIGEMLEPYLLEMSRRFDLSQVIAYAPREILRHSGQGNGDSGLGNLVADAMRTRRRVEAEFSITNTLGIRDNFYPGSITMEDMFNVFPFENTLAIMYLSSEEVQELLDFVTERSASRGCNSQAQVSGIRFTMNCGRVLENERNPAEFISPGEDITINHNPMVPGATYKVATNEYIAKGGSGFRVLQRNTTQFDTGVSLRDALIDYVRQLESCGDYEVREGGYCMRSDSYSRRICADIVNCDKYLDAKLTSCTPEALDSLPAVCREAVSSINCNKLKSVRGPYADVPCLVGYEDGRIRRLVSDNLERPSGQAGNDEVWP